MVKLLSCKYLCDYWRACVLVRLDGCRFVAYSEPMSEFGLIGGDFLRMDFREFSKLARFFEQFPVEARAACAQFLNDIGFLAKANTPLVLALSGHMHIRNQKFVGSRIRVQKTTAKPIDQQRVLVGSVAGDRFTGWIEQQRGVEPERSRTFSLLARGGDEAKQAKRSSRLLPDSDIVSTDDEPVQSGSRAQALIRDMAKNAPTKPFIIRRGYGVRPGLYKIKSKAGYVLPSSGRKAPKIQKLQAFDRKPKPKRWLWMQDVIHYTIKRAPIAKMWTSAMSRAWERVHASLSH